MGPSCFRIQGGKTVNAVNCCWMLNIVVVFVVTVVGLKKKKKKGEDLIGVIWNV